VTWVTIGPDDGSGGLVPTQILDDPSQLIETLDGDGSGDMTITMKDNWKSIVGVANFSSAAQGGIGYTASVHSVALPNVAEVQILDESCTVGAMGVFTPTDTVTIMFFLGA
jgi:hypothetical protein